MTDLNYLANEVMRRMEYQKTPSPVPHEEYVKMVINSIKELYILTGRAGTFDFNLIDFELLTYDMTFGIDEIEFILVSTQISFLEKVQAGVNAQVSYTTDALSVTKADMPYKNLSGSIAELKNKRRIIFYKMVAYVMD